MISITLLFVPVIDLSHPIVAGMITYPGLPGPVIRDYMPREASRKLYDAPTEFHIASIEMVVNTGTYVDVPSHRYASGEDLEQFPLERLADVTSVVLDVDLPDSREIVLPDLSGLNGKGVLLRTRWSVHWNTDRYHQGPYPFLGEQGARALIDAGVTLVGIDSLNVDDNSGGERPAHSMLLASRVPIVEHLTNLEALPGSEFRFHAAPLAIRGAGSFSVRAYAVVS